jgi:small subunit ribosomal protein S19
MGRSIKKGPFVEDHLLEKIQKAKSCQPEDADQDLVPPFDDHAGFCRPDVHVHNGKVFNPVFVTENMVGHKLGEFSLTRTFKKHGAHTAKAEAK